jgi:hypothetical protein
MAVIRDAAERQVFINNIRLAKAHTVLDITIANHCIGIVGRTATGGSSGFDFAIDAAAKAKRLGKLRTSKAPGGVIAFYGILGQGEGHAATTSPTGFIWQNDGPIHNEINYVPMSWPVQNWGLPYLGWCYPEDLWGPDVVKPAPKPPVVVVPKPPVVVAKPPVVIPQPKPVAFPGPLTGLVGTSPGPGKVHVQWSPAPASEEGTTYVVRFISSKGATRSPMKGLAGDGWGFTSGDLVTAVVLPLNTAGTGVGQAVDVKVK